MIEKINSIKEIDCWDKRDIFTVRILALLQAYGTSYPFAVFYKQIINGELTAVISKLDGDFTLSVSGEFDEEELSRFFLLSGYSSILSSDEICLFPKYDEGIVMKNARRIELPLGEYTVDEYPKLMDLYNFIDYNSSDFKAWYVDISHRIRHGTAKAYTLNLNGNVVSSGILSSIINGYSVLSAVRTENEYRNNGCGSALVSYIVNDVKGSVYLMRDEGMNEGFYKRLGFEDIGIWRMYR
ncbi:MAG: GNAT family N-acetyltransferase [Eubacterium sp.]|nr:GNAT family N-acetyltransferase [Eubacterium sp.]